MGVVRQRRNRPQFIERPGAVYFPAAQRTSIIRDTILWVTIQKLNETIRFVYLTSLRKWAASLASSGQRLRDHFLNSITIFGNSYTEQPCPLIFGTMGMETIGVHEDFQSMDM
jgi:hypothetical protein